MAGIVKHNWTAIFATLRADGWTPTSDGRTSLRKLADAMDIPIGTMVAKMRIEKSKGGGLLLHSPDAQPAANVIVDPDVD